MPLVSPSLLAAIQAQYRLDWHGPHGLGHWRRVHAIGARIAAAAGADARVVELFAYLHDACRHNDHRDPDHGPRAVDLARALRGRHFELEDAAFDTLCQALAGRPSKLKRLAHTPQPGERYAALDAVQNMKKC